MQWPHLKPIFNTLGYTTKDGVEIDPASNLGPSHWEAHSGSDDHHPTQPIAPGTMLASIHGWRFVEDSQMIQKVFPVDPDDRESRRKGRQVEGAVYVKANTTAFDTPVSRIDIKTTLCVC